MEVTWRWYAITVAIILAELLLGTMFISLIMSIAFRVSNLPPGVPGVIVSTIVFIVFIAVIFIIIPFMYIIHKTEDIKYVKDIEVSLDKFKIYNFDAFIVAKFESYAWAFKKSKHGFPFKELDYIPFRKYYTGSGDFKYAIPTIKLVK